MHPVMFLGVLLVGFLVSVDADAGADRVSFNNTPCTYPTANDDFAASFYSSLVTSIGAKKLKKLVLPGAQVAIQEYQGAIQLLSKMNVCSASMIFGSGSRGAALDKNKPLKKYIKERAFVVAEILRVKRVLRCDNAVTLALKLFECVQKDLKGMDLSKYESYMGGINKGIYDFFNEIGINFVKSLELQRRVYLELYKGEDPDMCKKSS